MNTDYLKDWDAQAEAAKTAFLELLYQESGRTNGLFTGLYLFAHSRTLSIADTHANLHGSSQKRTKLMKQALHDIVYNASVSR